MALILGLNSGSPFDGLDAVLAETELAGDGHPARPHFVAGCARLAGEGRADSRIVACLTDIDATRYTVTGGLALAPRRRRRAAPHPARMNSQS